MLAAAIREGRLDESVGVVVERLSLFGSCGRIVADRCGAPLLVEMNAPIAHEARAYRNTSLNQLADRIERQSLAAADLVLTGSDELRGDVTGRVGLSAKRVGTVANGVDLRLFSGEVDRAAVRRGVGVPADCLLFGFVGSLKEWHGVTLMLEAFTEAIAALPSAHLLVVGDTRRAPRYRDNARRLGIENRVTFCGSVDHVTAARLMMAMDIGLAPYLPQENFYFSPLKLYEYMAASLCVIASYAGQIRQVVQNGI